MMKTTTHSKLEVKDFLEIVLMWHCAGDIPMNRKTTCEFIEDSYFEEFLASVKVWADRFGVEEPSRRTIVTALHQLY